VKKTEWSAAVHRVREAAQDTAPISGLTHRFYRYPARFSPSFAAVAIEAFSKPGDTVLDPYMGGGTTIIEALVRQRHAVGCDLNSLAVFVSRVKTTVLSSSDRKALTHWADEPPLSYSRTTWKKTLSLLKALNTPRAPSILAGGSFRSRESWIRFSYRSAYS